MKRLSVTKEQVHVISAVTFGNILEWFEVYLFAYLSPIIAENFFHFKLHGSNLFLSLLIFGVGFITRPIGGLIFGRIGDLFGRKKAFLWSIITLTIPTFLMGLLPTYEKWGIFAPISLFVLRLLQSIPTGGEIPGVICYLYENAGQNNKRFITSWNAVGNQIGALVGLCEIFIMENYMSRESMVSWGWRISFLSGGIIGLIGIYLRHSLYETPVFLKLKESYKIDKEGIRQFIVNYRKKIMIGTAFGVIDAAAFYLIATYVPIFIGINLCLSNNENLLVSCIILIVTTIFLPIFGRLGDKYSNKAMCIGSALFILLLLYPLNIAINNNDMVLLSIIGGLSLIPLTCITALIAYLLGDLFPSQVRFTGIGISANLADGIIGGFTPAIAILLLQLTGNPASFCWYILCCATISLFSYLMYIKK
ncbi:MAG: MFS transporter [Parachlamydiales bacterium]